MCGLGLARGGLSLDTHCSWLQVTVGMRYALLLWLPESYWLASVWCRMLDLMAL